jgi:putative transposase
MTLKMTRRNLPHIAIPGVAYHLTFRLPEGRLSQEEIRLVLEHLKAGDEKYYDLFAAVVMPNHVHALLQPRPGIEMARITKGIKGASARKINQGRGTKGSVWDEERFDRIVRDEEDLEVKVRYILNNPVKAGLAKHGLDYEGMYIARARMPAPLQEMPAPLQEMPAPLQEKHSKDD